MPRKASWPRRVLLATGLAGGVGCIAGAASAEVILQNEIDRPVTVQVGTTSPAGMVEFGPVTLAPCATIAMTEGPFLRLLYPRFAADIDRGSAAIDFEGLALDQPGRLFLYLADPLVVVDGMGRGNCTPAPRGPRPG